MRYIKYFCLFCSIFMISPPFAGWAQNRGLSSPACASTAYIVHMFSIFFETFVWANQNKLSASLKDDLVYWTQYQKLLVSTYGHLEEPPSELILKNQLCHHLSKRTLRSTHASDQKLIAWFKKYGPQIINQIKNQSLQTREKLIQKQKESKLSRSENKKLNTYLEKILSKVKRDRF